MKIKTSLFLMAIILWPKYAPCFLITNTASVTYTNDFLIDFPAEMDTATVMVTSIPGTITDLSATAVTSTSTTLIWTAPGDDGYEGTATAYDIRYATFTITESNWDLTMQCGGEPIPKPAGAIETFTVISLQSAKTYFFAIKSSDGVNISSLSNIATATTKGTKVSGTISSDTTWFLSKSPYVVTGNILVDQGATLTIEPGVIVKFDKITTPEIGHFNGRGIEFIVRGILNAKGTPFNMITFTSNEILPAIYDYDAILLYNHSDPSTIKYCTIEYSGCGIIVESTSTVISYNKIQNCSMGVWCINGIFKISNNEITNMTSVAISCKSSPVISKNILINNRTGIQCDGPSSSPTIAWNNIYNNNWHINLSNNNPLDIIASNNWWGTTNTTTIDQHIWDYYDYSILGKVNYLPVLTTSNDIYAPPGTPTGLLVTNPATDGELELSWNLGTENDLAGYKIYYGTLSGSYTDIITLKGTGTVYTLENLINGITYHIVIAAYDEAENESDKSNELSGVSTGPLALIKIEGQRGIVVNGTLTLYLMGYDIEDFLIGDIPGTWSLSSAIGTLSCIFGTSTIFHATSTGIGTITATNGINIATATIIVGNPVDTSTPYISTLTASWGTATIKIGTNTESLIILPPEPVQGDKLQKLSGNLGFGIVVNAFGTSGNLFKGTFTNPICIEIHYNEIQLGDIDEKTLKLYISSDGGNTWGTISDYSLNIAENIIFGTFSHLSIIAPAGTSKQVAASHLNNVLAYPNPCKGYDKITFSNLTDQCKISIYTIARELVFEKEYTNTKGRVEWDLKNQSCKRVASGVYIYIITNKAGQKAVGKIGVVK